MLAGIQRVIDQFPNWTEGVVCICAVVLVTSPLAVWWFRQRRQR